MNHYPSHSIININKYVQKFSGRAEQPFARAYICSPGYVPGAGHELAEVSESDLTLPVML